MVIVRRYALQFWSIVIVLAMLLPLALIVACSTTSEGFVSFPPNGFSLRWYQVAVQTPQILDAFTFTLITAAATALISLALGATASYAISRIRFRGRGTVLAVLMSPFMVPQIVLAVGILQICSYAHVDSSPFGLVAGHIAITLPFVVRLVLSGLQSVDPRLEAVSRTLGASWPRTIWRVTVPGVRASLAAAGIFAFLLSFDETGVSVFTALPGVTTLPALVYQYAEQESTPTLTAMSSMLILFGCAMAVILERVFGLLRLLTGGAPP